MDIVNEPNRPLETQADDLGDTSRPSTRLEDLAMQCSPDSVRDSIRGLAG